MWSASGMANVLSEEKRQQVVGLGRLGWSLRRIEQATVVRRETVGQYLKAAGVAIRPPRSWGQLPPKPANEGITDPPQAISGESREATGAKPANEETTDPPRYRNTLKDSRSVCAPLLDFIEERIRLGRNAMAIYQDLVDQRGFKAGYISVRRFVRALKGKDSPELHAIIHTPAGEEGQVDYGEGPMGTR